MSWGTQLRAVLRKNFLVNVRSRGGALAMFVLPPLLLGFGVAYAFLMTNVIGGGGGGAGLTFDFPEAPLSALQNSTVGRRCDAQGATCALAFAPDDAASAAIAAEVAARLTADAGGWTMPLLLYANESALLAAMEAEPDAFFAGVCWRAANGSSFTVAMDASLLPERSQGASSSAVLGGISFASLRNASLFVESGFATVQATVESAALWLLPNSTSIAVSTKLLPAYSQNQMAGIASFYVAMLECFSWAPLLAIGLLRIAEEKASKAREFLFVSGLSKTAFWASWVITLGIPFASTAAIGIALKLGLGMLRAIDLPFILAVYVLFFFASMCFVFIVQTVISTPMLAMSAVGGWQSIAVMIAAFVPTFKALHGVLSLFSPFALYIAVSDTASSALAGPAATQLPHWALLLVLAADCVLYAAVAWYLNEVFTGDYGQSRNWKFLCQKSFWSRPEEPLQHGSLAITAQGGAFGCNGGDSDAFEVGNGMQKSYGIILRGIKKVYSGNGSAQDVVAVDGIYAAFARGNITTLLGENGAGKCLINPTSGDALVEGKSIVQDMSAIRREIGVCPQDETLYPLLSAAEHIHLVAKIKGVAGDLSAIAESALASVGFEKHEHKHGRSSTLSGGMKRRLSIAIASVGNPKVLMLDEPTAGVDPMSKREIWKLLEGLKVNRTVLLTTHSMDEADQISDYVMVIRQGKLKCGGSPMFLKQHFGCGYVLQVEKTASCSTETLLDDIRAVIPDAALSNDSRTVASIRIPAASTAQFPFLLRRIEENGASLGIGGFGASLTTLEDVFVRINTEHDSPSVSQPQSPASAEREDGSGGVGTSASAAASAAEDVVEVESPRETDRLHIHGDLDEPLSQEEEDAVLTRPSAWQQFAALTRLKALYFKRNIPALIMILTMPLVEIGIFLLVGKATMGATSSSGSAAAIAHGISEYTPLCIPYAVVSQNVSVTDLSSLLRSLSTDVIRFEEYPNVTSLQQSTLAAGGNPLGFLFRSLSVSRRVADVVLLYNQSWPDSAIIAENFIRTGISALFSPGSQNQAALFSQAIATSTNVLSVDLLSMMVGIGIGIAVFVTSCKPVEPLVHERECAFKTQLLAAGLRPSVYYLSSVFISAVSSIIVFIEAIVLVSIFRLEILSGQVLLAFFIGGVACAFAIAAFNFIFSNFFNNMRTSTAFLMLILLASAGLPYLGKMLFTLLPSVSEALGTQGTTAIFLVLDLLAPFAFLEFVFALCGMPAGSSLAACFNPTNAAFRPFCMLCVDAVVFSLLAIAIECFKDRIKPAARLPSRPIAVPDNEDEDVAKERDRVETTAARHAIACKQLRKEFGKLVAVNNLSFGVQDNECFGLLGPNAQGKTTTVNMLLGFLQPTHGVVSLHNSEVHGFRSSVHASARLGTCAQSGGLLDYLTGREHLEFLSLIRSKVTPKQAKLHASRLLVALGMEAHADKRVKTYSGGTARKCSSALAMLPGARLVVLDEPSTGLDVLARRALWAEVRRVRTKPGGVVLLTTHSLEEAESACTTVSIIDHGALACFGSVQHLKARFSSGYTLVVDLEPNFPPAAEAQCDALATAAVGGGSSKPAAVLTDVVETRRTYSLGHPRSLAHTFATMEQAKAASGTAGALRIRGYTIQQASLSQIFANVVKKIAETN